VRRLVLLCVAATVGITAPGLLSAQLPLASKADTLGWWRTAEALRAVANRGTASTADIFRLAEAELALGRAEEARRLLRQRSPADSLGAVGFALLGTAEFGAGYFSAAGEAFTAALEGYQGRQRGLLAARAAESYRLAGADSLAATLYGEAGRNLPAVAGWLAVREAMVTPDPARALALLRRAPPEAAVQAARIRAGILLSTGDSAGALLVLSGTADWDLVLPIALALDDSASARQAAYEILAAPDTAGLRRAVTTVRDRFAPGPRNEVFLLAAGLNRLGQVRDAVAVLQAAAARGDSSSALLRRLADLQSAAGQPGDALRTYGRAAASPDEDGGLAAYRRARLLVRTGPADSGYAALASFAKERPRHPQAPLALYLVADGHRGQGRLDVADSLFEAVAVQWPSDTYASRARQALAQEALASGDATRAATWYQAELDAQGTQGPAAQYFLADLARAAGDTATAAALWSDLADSDAVGYYGTLAAMEVTSDVRRFLPAPPVPQDEDASRTLERVDLLFASFLAEEAEVVIRRQLQRTEFPDDELFALAHGLIERGWVQEGVTLGWRAARHRSLRDPVVLRLVFPYPMRALVEREAAEQGLDPYLVAALIRQESNFRPAVVSRAGAHGLMQLMPQTAREVARRAGVRWDVRYLESAEANLHLGATHLAGLLRQYDGQVVPALAAYNAGGRPVSRWLRYPEAADPVRFVERIPYAETRGYVRSVLRNRELYRQIYPPSPSAGEP
jgi:soluble lytic murein transglycosylase